MPYPKGISGNPWGRPKGAANKATKRVRKVIGQVLAGVTAESLAQKLEALQGKEYLDAYIKLAEFVTPKLQRMAPAEENMGPIDVDVFLGGHDQAYSLIDQEKTGDIAPNAVVDDQ
ncbi:hypothetical protein [Hymenobacter sp. BT491]|uniref:hypothetical protein n=1 Tax=Hymenobacter sp. BT491 TaxID=2766779 RepID=UPI0016536A9C|nr:hypothetical protein [Hymenobacter sp. BT491]MBC6991674.1 hypothetical protein [Hymenobacter sp. BT491]